MGVCVGVCTVVCVKGLGRSLAWWRVPALGEDGNMLHGRGIPDGGGGRGADFTLTPPLILTLLEKQKKKDAFHESKQNTR